MDSFCHRLAIRPANYIYEFELMIFTFGLSQNGKSNVLMDE